MLSIFLDFHGTVSNFLAVCQQVKEMLKSNAVAITLPIGEESDFKGVVDLVKNQAIVWHDETQGATFDIIDIPADMVDDVIGCVVI